MRVIAGSAGGTRLVAPDTRATRPITDRAKEGLFNILAPRLEGARVLDLFAGTGAIGIEALSRGAAHAVLVEVAGAAVHAIQENLRRTHLEGAAEVVRADVFAYLERPPAPFDVVCIAPPQWRGLWARALAALDRRPGWLAAGACVVVQCDPREVAEVALETVRRTQVRRYGDVAFILHDAVDAGAG